MAPKYQYKEEHGVQWLLVFYHNAHDNIIFKDDDEAINCNTNSKFSILNEITPKMRINSMYEFLLEYPSDFPGEYNRWNQSWNPLDPSGRQPDGFNFTHKGWDYYQFAGLALTCRSANQCCPSVLDGTSDETWWYSIGMISLCDTQYGQPKPPGPSAQVNEIVLWLRINKRIICTCKQYFSFKKIITISFILLIK